MQRSGLKALSKYDFTIIYDSVNEAAKRFVIVANAARLKQSEEDEEKFAKHGGQAVFIFCSLVVVKIFVVS